MSLPRFAWIAAAPSGVSRVSAPSYTFLKVTPSSSTRAMVSLSEKTWNPPESVRIGRLQPMNRWRPPSSAIVSSPGRKCRW